MNEKGKIFYVDNHKERILSFTQKVGNDFNIIPVNDLFSLFNELKSDRNKSVIVSNSAPKDPNGLPLLELLDANPETRAVPFLLLCNNIHDDQIIECLKRGVSDCFEQDFETERFITRTNFLINQQKSKHSKNKKFKAKKFKMPLVKRIFDILFSATALILLSPLFLIIAILLRLDSKGPIFYSSKRAGTGYRVFDFYKFRSMSVDADKRLKEISHLNQYSKKKAPAEAEENKPKNSKCDECALYDTPCKFPLHFDSYSVCEKIYMMELGEKVDGKFIKVKNDPRVTKFGAFIRNTSIDELPQLFNVLIGDMSIVGNRPLPLYEAEKLTTDQFTLRFMAPAGITGLWQVTKRGKKGPMSDEERMELDNEYARNYTLFRDIEIILKTIPALLQKENV